jgi:uncharacterized membrane protein
MAMKLPEAFPNLTGSGTRDQRGRSAPPWLTITLITALALAIRLAWLGSKSLWVDEADSVYFASHSFPDIFSRLCDPHPPGYYALLRVFLAWGQSEFWVRLPSAIAGTLTVPLLVALGRELDAVFAHNVRSLGHHTAVLASLLLAVAPLHVWYSQEARMYALVTLLGLCAVYLALRFALRRRVGDALAYVLAAIAALYVDQSSALPLLLANVLWGGMWLRQRQLLGRRGWREPVTWAGLQVVVGIVFWLWWSQALYASLFDTGTLYQLAMMMLVLQRLGVPAALADLRLAFTVGAAVLAAVGVFVYWWSMRRGWMRQLVPALAPVVMALFVLVTIGSAIPRGFTAKRLLISLWPYGMLAGAWAMYKLKIARQLMAALVTLSLALSVINAWLVPKEPWREVVATVQQEIDLHDTDTLWVDELAVPAFDYYYSGSRERHILRMARLYELSNDFSATGDAGQRDSASGGRVWVVTRVDPYRNLLDYLPASAVQEPVWSRDWHRVSVRAYARTSPGTSPSIPDAAPPSWMLAWPSPVDEDCQEHE